MVKSLRAEHAMATKAALIAAGRELFTTRGFASSSSEQIVALARVTRGALYHHFKDKKDLFCVVLNEVATEVSAKIATAAEKHSDPWDALMAGIDAFLDACIEGDFHRIVILDGPSVLGWQEWREGEGTYAIDLLRMGLTINMEAGNIAKGDVELLAPVILGALNEAGMHVATAKNKKKTRTEAGETMRRLIEGLRV